MFEELKLYASNHPLATIIIIVLLFVLLYRMYSGYEYYTIHKKSDSLEKQLTRINILILVTLVLSTIFLINIIGFIAYIDD